MVKIIIWWGVWGGARIPLTITRKILRIAIVRGPGLIIPRLMAQGIMEKILGMGG